MKPASKTTKNPLKPEVLAVIRSSFDGYNEPDAKTTPRKPSPKKPSKTQLH